MPQSLHCLYGGLTLSYKTFATKTLRRLTLKKHSILIAEIVITQDAYHFLFGAQLIPASLPIRCTSGLVGLKTPSGLFFQTHACRSHKPKPVLRSHTSPVPVNPSGGLLGDISMGTAYSAATS